VLVVDGINYKLRRDDVSNTYTPDLVMHADRDSNQKKQATALAEQKSLDADGHFVCLIGWTRLPEVELREICKIVTRKILFSKTLSACRTILTALSKILTPRYQRSSYVWISKHIHRERRHLPIATTCRHVGMHGVGLCFERWP